MTLLVRLKRILAKPDQLAWMHTGSASYHNRATGHATTFANQRRKQMSRPLDWTQMDQSLGLNKKLRSVPQGLVGSDLYSLSNEVYIET